MNLTPSAYLVLGVVNLLGSASPYDVKVEAGRTVAPFWQVPHAQVYALCDRLVEAGLLEQEQEGKGRQRRVMRLTDAGRDALREWLADTVVTPVEARERGMLKMWLGGSPREHAPAQIAAHGRTLAEYEELARLVGDQLTPGQRHALEFGIRYERMMVGLWRDALEQAPS
ncbi:helix-turn-helix transcriptional regulator [Actinomadura rayongensis]|uniref:PadR family transcriptional regulator n=1 Tax=Actinomadura rayongensis TaxID=1429076 RepID=A0A6I4WD15_9ACTN|nr:PadR family transcriptional regulator [Actinomadura rayongensis]